MTLISKLYATGLVIDVETLAWDKHQIAKMKEFNTHRGAIKGEMHRIFEFKREPLRAKMLLYTETDV